MNITKNSLSANQFMIVNVLIVMGASSSIIIGILSLAHFEKLQAIGDVYSGCMIAVSSSIILCALGRYLYLENTKKVKLSPAAPGGTFIDRVLNDNAISHEETGDNLSDLPGITELSRESTIKFYYFKGKIEYSYEVSLGEINDFIEDGQYYEFSEKSTTYFLKKTPANDDLQITTERPPKPMKKLILQINSTKNLYAIVD